MKIRFFFAAVLSSVLLIPTFQVSEAAPRKGHRKKSVRRKATTNKSGLTPRQRIAAQNSLRALKRLESAVSIGTTYMDFSQRLVDTNVIVEENLQLVPAGILKSEMQAAMKAYSTARGLWDITTSNGADMNAIMRQALAEQGRSPEGFMQQASVHIAKAGQLLK